MDLRKERTLKYLSQSLVDLMGDKPLAHITVRWWFNECGGQDEELLIKALDDVSARLFG